MTTGKKSDESLCVLHIGPTPFFSDRGCHMRIRGIICALNKHSIASSLCTYNLGNEVEGVKTIRTTQIPGYTKLEAGPSAFKYIADILLFFVVCKQIFKQRPDILHAHLHEGVIIAWTARLFFFWRKTPLVFDVQGSLVGELQAHGYFEKFSFLKRVFWFLEYLTTRMADQFLCSSQNTLTILRNEFNVSEQQSVLVNDGAEEFTISKNSGLAQSLKLPADKAIVVYSGALLEAKGLTQLCEIILEANKRASNCHFLLIGYPQDAMIEFCIQHKLTSLCTLTGRVAYDQLGNYLALADIALEPKLSNSGEASGKLLNYMGAGLPVVCFDNHSNRDLLGETGLFAASIPNPDIEGLVDHIETIIVDPQAGRRQGAAGKLRVKKLYSWGKAGSKVLKIYNSLLGRK